MAEPFEIKVVTTADTSGLKEASAGMEELRIKSSRISEFIGKDASEGTKRLSIEEANRLGRLAEERRRALRSALTAVPEELKTGAASVVSEIEKVAPSTLFAGINLARARQEAMFLARELATGVPTTRTLSSLLGSLGPMMAGAVGAGFVLNRALVANAERQLKINQELDAQLTKITALQQKWNLTAQSVTSYEDALKLTAQIIPTLDEASAKFREFQATGVSVWKEALDKLTAGIPGAGKIFENLFQTQANKLADNVEMLRQSAQAAADLGESYKEAFKGERAKPLTQAISDLTAKIKEHLAVAETLRNSGDIQGYATKIALAQKYKADLSEIIKLQAQERAQADAAAKKLGLTTPTGQFISEQQKAGYEHEAQRAALEQKRREAVATGDEARARAIEDELKEDRFARDQRKEQLQRYVANQESISGGPLATQSDRLKALGEQGLRKYESATDELSRIYGQQKKEGVKDYGGDILQVLNKILDQFR